MDEQSGLESWDNHNCGDFGAQVEEFNWTLWRQIFYIIFFIFVSLSSAELRGWCMDEYMVDIDELSKQL